MQLRDRGNGEYLLSWKNKQQQLEIEREEEDVDVYVVHAYAGQMLGTSLIESESHSIDLDLIEDNQELLARGHHAKSVILDIHLYHDP